MGKFLTYIKNTLSLGKDKNVVEKAVLGKLRRQKIRMPSLQAIAICLENSNSEVNDPKLLATLEDLSKGGWESDFSYYISRDDELVRTPEGVAKITPGAFIAFISVDDAPEGETEGRRHLVHAMISLGNGDAIGFNNRSALGIGNDNEWERVDLQKQLRWNRRSNGYDIVHGVGAAIEKVRPLRIRWRNPDKVVLNDVDQDGTRERKQPVWGKPSRSSDLLDEIATKVKAVTSIKIVTSDKQPDFFRPEFKFWIDVEYFQKLFNSPNELRGHYYKSAKDGDKYTNDTLAKIADNLTAKNAKRIKKKKTKNTSTQIEDGIALERLSKWGIKSSPEQIFQSFAHGKIWFDESGQHDFIMYEALDEDLHLQFEGNDRWKGSYEALNDNFISFVADAGLGLFDAKAEAIKTKLVGNENAVGQAASGATYFDFDPKGPGGSAENATNIDVKGAWIRKDGKKGSFTPPDKAARGLQLHWFGYT